MDKKDIEKLIKSFSLKKQWILKGMYCAMMIFLGGVLISIIFEFDIIAIVGYVMLIVLMVVAYSFVLNRTLINVTSRNDYIAILDYLENFPEGISKREYLDAVYIIKESLNEVVYNKMNILGNDTYVNDNVFFIQSRFHFNKNYEKEIFDENYLKLLGKRLREQLSVGYFNANELENMVVTENMVVAEGKLKKNSINLIDVCNIIFLIIIAYKLIITLNNDLYNIMNEKILLRLIYNIGADIITISIAGIALMKKVKRR